MILKERKKDCVTLRSALEVPSTPVTTKLAQSREACLRSMSHSAGQ